MEKTRESIERYLRGEMTADELKNFTFQMVMNPNLRKEIEEARTIFKTLRTQPEPKSSFWQSWIFLSLLVLSIAFGSYYVWNLNSVSDDTTPVESPTRPIAEAGKFKPNETLEGFTGALRTEGIQILQQPDLENFISKNNQFVFELKIKLTGDEILNNLLLSVWTNREEDYVNDNSVLLKELTVSGKNTIEFREALNLSEGLYYFILAYENDKLIKSDKFTVRYK